MRKALVVTALFAGFAASANPTAATSPADPGAGVNAPAAKPDPMAKTTYAKNAKHSKKTHIK